jgi:feruloyl esterase
LRRIFPGNGHGSQNGTANPAATPPVIEWPRFYQLLIDWVEKGAAPDRIDISSPGKAVRISQSVCPYPAKPAYKGGDPKVAASYDCAG